MDVVFTIVSRNYAAQAATLMESLAVVEPGARRVVVATDGPIPALAGRAEVLDAAALDAPFAAMALYYDALELNTAVKPSAFRRLLEEPGVASVTYLDPDIFVYRPLDAVREGLARAQLCLTPHLTRPLAGPAEPNDHTILRSGSYNLGFMAARRDPEVFALLDWWAGKCRLDCRVDFAQGLFTDQRWMDLAPGFVTDFARLRQPGLNLAYWNLEGRDLRRVEDEWRVDGEPLAFFHFSGFDPARPELLSKHQNRTQAAAGSPLAALLEDYARALLRNGHAAAAATPYAHDRFASGRGVSRPMRRRTLRAVQAGEGVAEGLSAAAEAWLDAPDPQAAAPGLPDVTRLMDQVWRDAPQAAAFDRDTVEGRLAFHAWFDRAGPGLGADGPAVEAGRRLLRAFHGGAREPALSPWRDAPNRGPAGDVARWLRDASPDGAPRACSALLSARSDLRLRFADDPQGLLAWCLGVEAPAGRFAADLLPPQVIADLAREPAPLARAGRMADPSATPDPLRHALFTAFSLARRAHWPRSWRNALQAPFVAPAPEHPAPFITLFLAIWQDRSDLQRLFPLRTALERLKFLRWLVGGGLAEYGVEFASLPAAVRGHPWTRLAGLTVRGAPDEAGPEAAAGRCAVLAVVEGRASIERLPAAFVAYDARDGVFRLPSGKACRPPEHAEMVFFLTRPALVAADAIALHAHGVRWSAATGVWTAAEAGGLSDGDAVLGFVDAILTPDAPDLGLFRTHGRLDPAQPRDAALTALIAT